MDKKNTIEKLEKLLNHIIKHNLQKEAFVFIARLSELRKKIGDDPRFDSFLIKAKLIALPLLENKEIINLARNNFSFIFSIIDYNVREKIKSKMINLIIVSDRDELKKELKKALEDNEEVLTAKKLVVNDNILSPTVGNWLKDYIINVGNHSADKVKQSQYLTVSNNIKKIEQNEKNKIKNLIELYEYLKLSSSDPLGHEESYQTEIDGKLYNFHQGVLQAYDKKLLNDMDFVLKRLNKDDKENFQSEFATQPISDEDKKSDKEYLEGEEQKVSKKEMESKTIKPIEIKTLKQEKEIDAGDIFFDKSDDKEIEKMQAETDKLKNSAGVQVIDLSLEADQIIERLNLQLNAFLTSRFKNIIISVLKGIRDKIGLRDVLRRSIENGGIGMEAQKVDKVLEEILDQKLKIKDKPVIIKKQETKNKKQDLGIKNEESRSKNYELGVKSQGLENKKDNDIKILPKEEKNDLLAEQKKDSLLKIGKIKAIAPPPPVLKPEARGQILNIGSQKSDFGKQKDVENLKSKIEISGKETIKEDKEKKEGFFGKLFGTKKEDQEPRTKNQELRIKDEKLEVGNQESRIKDKEEKKQEYLNKEKPKLVGIIEEIENLNINDFRGWFKDPMKAIKKIEEKIDIAGEKFFEKRALGIKAWKRSEINKLYLDILNDGLIKHKPIEEIIKEKEKEGKIVLSKDEFEAIMELNKRLRF